MTMFMEEVYQCDNCSGVIGHCEYRHVVAISDKYALKQPTRCTQSKNCLPRWVLLSEREW